MTSTLLLATNNLNKMGELREILTFVPVSLVSAKDTTSTNTAHAKGLPSYSKTALPSSVSS
jgi:inosine/xanthosine triphosphate pyrophosphatase family protein